MAVTVVPQINATIRLFTRRGVVSGEEVPRALTKIIQDVGERSARQVVALALVRLQRIYERELKRAAPVRTGALKRSIRVRRTRFRREIGGRLTPVLGVERNGARYGWIQQFDRTQPHFGWMNLPNRIVEDEAPQVLRQAATEVRQQPTRRLK